MEDHTKMGTVDMTSINQKPLQGKVAWTFESCNFCNYKTQSVHIMNNHLTRHKLTHQPNKFDCNMYIDRYRCRMCDFDSDTLVSYKKHVKLSHEKVVEVKPEQNPFIKKEQTEKFVFGNFMSLVKKPNHLKRFKCQLCGFKSHSVLTHLKHSVDCECCDTNEEISNRGSENEDTESADEDPVWSIHNYAMNLKTKWYQCKKATGHYLSEHKESQLHSEFSTAKKEYLNQHMRSVRKADSSGAFRCIHCPYQTGDANSFKSHVKIEHVECVKCSAIFSGCGTRRPRVVKRERFKCVQCNWLTYSEWYLVMHMEESHPGSESVIQCDQCWYKTLWPDRLKRHVDAEHKVAAWTCNNCDFVSVSRASSALLERHLESCAKNWVRCEFCHFKCTESVELQQHVLDHHVTLCFECRPCSIRTIDKGALRRHVLDKHIPQGGESKCGFCTWEGASNEELKKHILNIHYLL